MSDWMSGPHRAQRTVSLEVTPDSDPVELTEPVEVVAWLRALPPQAVLLSNAESGRPYVWQVRAAGYLGETGLGTRAVVLMIGSEEMFELTDDDDAATLAAEAPFRVLWMPGGAT